MIALVEFLGGICDISPCFCFFLEEIPRIFYGLFDFFFISLEFCGLRFFNKTYQNVLAQIRSLVLPINPFEDNNYYISQMA